MPAIAKTPTDQLKSRTQSCIDKYSRLNGIDVKRIAKIMGVTERAVYGWIDNPEKISLGNMWRLSTILKCPVGELCGGDTPEEAIGKWVAAAMNKR